MTLRVQGVLNILRYNWHYFAISGGALCVLLIVRQFCDPPWSWLATLLIVLLIVATSVSLGVSWYVYDLSELYSLRWLDRIDLGGIEKAAVITVGLDEFGEKIRNRFTTAELRMVDLYDDARHTEASIRRARKSHPLPVSVESATADRLPFEQSSIDVVFLLLTAHEIRVATERVALFRELARVLTPQGKIIVTEHLRDAANVAAYNVGALHFHSKSTWMQAFSAAQLTVKQTMHITPFLTTFILGHYGSSS